MSALPRKRASLKTVAMSAKCQKQTAYSITSSARVSSAANSLDEIASPRFAISEMEVNDQFALQNS
jgi:hypothetical protein